METFEIIRRNVFNIILLTSSEVELMETGDRFLSQLLRSGLLTSSEVELMETFGLLRILVVLLIF